MEDTTCHREIFTCVLEGRVADAAAYALRIHSAVAHEKGPSRETLYIVGFAAIF